MEVAAIAKASMFVVDTPPCGTHVQMCVCMRGEREREKKKKERERERESERVSILCTILKPFSSFVPGDTVHHGCWHSPTLHKPS